MGRKTLRVDRVETGMKLASAVVSVSGQRLMASGTVVDAAKIQLLKKAGIRYVQIFERGFEDGVDATAFNDLLKNIGPAVMEAPAPPVSIGDEPVHGSPGEAPPSARIDEIRRMAAELKARQAEDKKRYVEKFGERYSTISYTMGEPVPRVAAGKDAPYVDLMGILARNVSDKMIFERKSDEEAVQTLVRDVVAELSERRNVMELLTTAYSVSRYLMSHMLNVSIFSIRLAAEMKLTSKEILDISVGAMLHDIGMVLIPVNLWTTRRELAPQARLEVQTHTTLGAQLIRETPGTQESWAVPAQEHHERLDGGGYPRGLSGDSLSVSSRIVQICDVYEALTSDRSYRYAKFPDMSMKHIMGSPDQFDREVSQAFCKCLGFYPEGYSVKLASGEQAVVLNANPKNVFRPLIRLVADPNGGSLPQESQVEIDLTKRLDLRITEISNRRYVAAL